jgi:hypothetical protein
MVRFCYIDALLENNWHPPQGLVGFMGGLCVAKEVGKIMKKKHTKRSKQCSKANGSSKIA